MILSLLIGLIILIGVMMFVRGVTQLSSQALLRLLIGIIVGGVILGVVFLFVFRRFDLALALLPFLLPLGMRLWHRSRTRRTSDPSQRFSNVNTRFLKMYLDHDTGAMDGLVYDGQHKGKWLSKMSIDDVMTLLEEYRAKDPQSGTLIETWLDRMHGEQWRQQQKSQHSKTAVFDDSIAMTRDQAYHVLGLAHGASVDQIKEAYRRLMLRVHPDHGGTSFFAIQLNRARDVLLQDAGK